MWRTSSTNWRTLASAIFSTHFLFPVTVDMACNIVWGQYYKVAYHRMAEDDSIASNTDGHYTSNKTLANRSRATNVPRVGHVKTKIVVKCIYSLNI